MQLKFKEVHNFGLILVFWLQHWSRKIVCGILFCLYGSAYWHFQSPSNAASISILFLPEFSLVSAMTESLSSELEWSLHCCFFNYFISKFYIYLGLLALISDIFQFLMSFTVLYNYHFDGNWNIKLMALIERGIDYVYFFHCMIYEGCSTEAELPLEYYTFHGRGIRQCGGAAWTSHTEHRRLINNPKERRNFLSPSRNGWA